MADGIGDHIKGLGEELSDQVKAFFGAEKKQPPAKDPRAQIQALAEAPKPAVVQTAAEAPAGLDLKQSEPRGALTSIAKGLPPLPTTETKPSSKIVG